MAVEPGQPYLTKSGGTAAIVKSQQPRFLRRHQYSYCTWRIKASLKSKPLKHPSIPAYMLQSNGRQSYVLNIRTLPPVENLSPAPVRTTATTVVVEAS